MIISAANCIDEKCRHDSIRKLQLNGCNASFERPQRAAGTTAEAFREVNQIVIGCAKDQMLDIRRCSQEIKSGMHRIDEWNRTRMKSGQRTLKPSDSLKRTWAITNWNLPCPKLSSYRNMLTLGKNVAKCSLSKKIFKRSSLNSISASWPSRL